MHLRLACFDDLDQKLPKVTPQTSMDELDTEIETTKNAHNMIDISQLFKKQINHTDFLDVPSEQSTQLTFRERQSAVSIVEETSQQQLEQ